MDYRNLGRSGLKVSELSFGSWLTFHNALDHSQTRKLMQLAFDHGVNFFDNAEVYADGESERLMGEALKNFRRSDVVVSTKIFWGGKGPNDTGLSWKHLVEGTKAALRRMQIEYVDLLFCHRPDPSTPVEETARAIDTLIRQGHVFYWGTSEWPAERIEQAFAVCAAERLVPPTMEQPQYNMFVRDRVEREYSSLFKKFGIGTTTWSPLASGVLTGKYNDGIPNGSRLAEQEWLRKWLTPENTARVKQLTAVARDIGCSVSQLAIAWCLQNAHVSSVILGATNQKQLEENLGASAVKSKFSAEIVTRIETIFTAK